MISYRPVDASRSQEASARPLNSATVAPVTACGCLGRPAAAEDRKLAQEALFPRREQAPGVVERGDHAPVPGGHIPHRRGQHVQAVLQLLRDPRQRQCSYPGGGQLDGEGIPFQQAADVDDVARIVGGGLEIGPHPADAGEEERRGAVAFEDGGLRWSHEVTRAHDPANFMRGE